MLFKEIDNPTFNIKSNEITAIPKRLERLDITGTIVTLDAIGYRLCPTHRITSRDTGITQGRDFTPPFILTALNHS